MTLPITTTKADGAAYVNILVHGGPGVGKTTLMGTTGDPDHTLIISAEGGLMPLREMSIPVVDVVAYSATLSKERGSPVGILEAMREVYKHLARGAHGYTWVGIDSISEVAEQQVAWELTQTTHGIRAYGELLTKMNAVIRAFRDLPLNVVMTCKQAREANDEGGMVLAPSLPGKKLSQGIGYHFDEVFAMVAKSKEDGTIGRWLLTQANGTYEAKDRSDSLAMWEKPDLGAIVRKIQGAP